MLGSCSNDLDVNAEWKDITVVFGLLNKNEKVHYIKIGRAFLGEGDAMQFAGVYDSLNYDPDIIEARVEELDQNGNVLRGFKLQPYWDIPKEPGAFAGPSQVAYSFETPDAPLNTENEYRLIVRNLKSGNELRGTTKVIDSPVMTRPSVSVAGIQMVPAGSAEVRWNTVEGGALYELFARFVYREFKLGGDTVRKYVEMPLGRQIQEMQGSMSLRFEYLRLYRTLNQTLKPSDINNPTYRMADSLIFYLNVADKDLYTYISVNEPSNTLAQERPQYNNVENGVGLFASRSVGKRAVRLHNDAVDSLRSNPLTRELNFMKR